eukprot:TRINITY_DN533_c0_g1_i5.p1 TRINITY_DN533_c0_g1~~TRINITY_DN533_c0_g1_i5.p1  ORF type:complete len:394 (-),score=67.24 TRINITY_DN533_c0_g1_i5:443-1624(-)
MDFLTLLLHMLLVVTSANRYVLQKELAQAEASECPIPSTSNADCCSMSRQLVAVCENQEMRSNQKKTGWENCNEAVYQMWSEKNLTDRQKSWVHDMYMVHTLADNTAKKALTTPVFWAGFSHALGTRQVMDAFIAALPDCNALFKCVDVEHKESKLGKVMRKGNWFRSCHKSKLDRDLWIHFSQAFGYRRKWLMNSFVKARDHNNVNSEDDELNLGLELTLDALDERIKKTKEVHILLNYVEAKLNTTFLFEYELPLLAASPIPVQLQLWTFKAPCKAVNNLLPKELKGAQCWSPQEEGSPIAPQEMKHIGEIFSCLDKHPLNGGKDPTCFFQAARKGLLQVVAELSQKFSGLATSEIMVTQHYTKQQMDGNTALLFAARSGHLETVKLLGGR